MAHVVVEGCGCSYEMDTIPAMFYNNRRHQMVDGSLKRCDRHAAQWKRICNLVKQPRRKKG